jgi:hypothetical protein
LHHNLYEDEVARPTLYLPEASFEEKTFFNIVNKEGITLPQMSEE